MIRRTTVLGLAAVMSLFVAGLTPDRAAAQSELDVAQASEFMGYWLVSFETDQGPFLVELEFTDEDGKVGASVTTLPLGTQQVSDITRADDTLTLQWEADAQGQLFPILVVLTSRGEEIDVDLDIGMGELAMTGIGKRSPA